MKEKKTEYGESPYFVAMLNYYFHTGVIPFKVVHSSSSGRYILKESRGQQLICGFSHTACLLSLTMGIVSTFTYSREDKSQVGNVVVVLEAFINLFFLAASLALFHVIWNRKADCLEITERTRLSSNSCGNPRKIVVTVQLVLFAVDVLFLMTYLSFTIENYEVFMMIPYEKKSDYGNLLKGLNFVILWAVLYFGNFFMKYLMILFIMFIALTHLAFQFETKLKQMSGFEVSDGVLLYRELKKTSGLIRKTFGNFIFACYFTYIVFLTDFPYVLLIGQTSWTEQSLMIFTLSTGTFWGFAAEFHNIVKNTIQNWTKCHLSVSKMGIRNRILLSMISSEVASNNNGVAISSNYLSLTYNSIGSMIGVIVTYAIVIVQLNQFT